MQYLCRVYSEEDKLHTLSDSPKDDECMAYADALQRNGHLLAAEALESVQTASTIRVRSGKRSVSDGPYAETKEQLAGCYLIDTRDLNEATQVAAKIPPARVGSIKTHPVRQLSV